MVLNMYVSLVFQIPAEKAFWVGFWRPSTSSQGGWKPTVYVDYTRIRIYRYIRMCSSSDPVPVGKMGIYRITETWKGPPC